MRKMLVLFLALILLAVPVAAEGYYVVDDSALLEDYDVDKLEQVYSEYEDTYGFTPVLVTTDSFGGLYADEFAQQYYDLQEYPEDGILLLVSLGEGEWYIYLNGQCLDRITDWGAETIGEELVPLIREGSYYGAFLKFPELAMEIYEANELTFEEDFYFEPVVSQKNYGKTIAICMVVGLVIGLIAVGIMASQMKSVHQQSGASDYIRPGSMHVTHSRDIFLYSRVTRTAKPKNNSSSGGSRSSGGSGGAGGRL